jgi:hypothetical protein
VTLLLNYVIVRSNISRFIDLGCWRFAGCLEFRGFADHEA